MTDIGKCIRMAQTAKNVSSTELAQKLKVHRQTIHRYRTSDDLKFSIVEKVSGAIGVSVPELLEFDR